MIAIDEFCLACRRCGSVFGADFSVRSSARVWILTACVAAVTVGCKTSTESYAEVTGKVTIEGVPATKVLVTFEPQSQDPRKMRPASFGPTNENGEFRMMRKATLPGVVTGLHHVRITPIEQDGGKNTVVHPRYQANNALWAEVAPGNNVIDFELREDPTAPKK